MGREALEQGQSPLTRGRRGLAYGDAPAQRSIPAHAGEAVMLCMSRTVGWVNPRSRGGGSCSSLMARFSCGQSPLTRGRL